MRLLVLPTLLLGCVAPEKDGDVPVAESPLAATLTPSAAIGTVAMVDFTTPAGAVGRVEVWEAEGPVRTFPAVADETGALHAAQVAGLPAGTAVSWRAVATLEDGTERASEAAVFETEPPPLWLQPLTVTVPADDPWAPGFVLTTIIGDSPGAAMFDRHGRYVWWWASADGTMPCQARLGRDGESILLMVVDDAMTEDVGTIVRVGFDGETRWEQRVSMGHHDFVELEDGRIGYLAFDIRAWEARTTVGDTLMVLDPATGDEAKIWSVWNDLDPASSEESSFYPFGVDWTHGNGLAHDPASDTWTVSLHNLDALVRISADGALLWQLGGMDSDFTLEGGGTGFARQHSPVLTAGGLLMFDNHRPDADALFSRGLEVALDEKAMTYREVWSYDGDQDLFTAYMGASERLPDGSTLIGWGSGGRITEVSPSGQLAWQLDAAIGSPFGFTHPVAALGEVVE